MLYGRLESTLEIVIVKIFPRRLKFMEIYVRTPHSNSVNFVTHFSGLKRQEVKKWRLNGGPRFYNDTEARQA
jgi:hypothetical protein